MVFIIITIIIIIIIIIILGGEVKKRILQTDLEKTNSCTVSAAVLGFEKNPDPNLATRALLSPHKHINHPTPAPRTKVSDCMI